MTEIYIDIDKKGAYGLLKEICSTSFRHMPFFTVKVNNKIIYPGQIDSVKLKETNTIQISQTIPKHGCRYLSVQEALSRMYVRPYPIFPTVFYNKELLLKMCQEKAKAMHETYIKCLETQSK